MFEHSSGVAGAYDRTPANPSWKDVIVRDDKYAQGAELNEVQSIIRNRNKRTSDLVAADGDRIYGGDILVDPATGTVIHTLTIPRGMVVMAKGHALADDTSFEVVATHVDENYGICATPFLDHAFKTRDFRIKVEINSDGSWSYEEDTVLLIKDKIEPFHHTDRNLLFQIAPPTPNPLARTYSADTKPRP